MMYKRYGKLYFKDMVIDYFVITFWIVLIAVALLINVPYYLLICPIIFLIIRVWSLYKIQGECFWFSKDMITIIQNRKKVEIFLPSELILVISYADICSPLAKRTNIANETTMLKGRYAISILKKIPLETVFNRLHEKYTRKYTNNIIEECFNENQYIYSFVGNQELLNGLLINRSCQIIIPETLQNQLSIDINSVNVHIDAGY